MSDTQSQGCLAQQQLARLIGGELQASDRAAAEAHLSGCAGCRERLARRLDDIRPVAAEPAPEELKRIARDLVPASSAARRSWLPLAAAALLAIGLGIVWRVSAPEPQVDGETLRDSSTAATVELAQPPPGAVVSGERTLFSWQPIESARRYDFTLVNEVGDVITEARTTEASLELPRATLAIATGDVCYWSVRALLRDGTVVDSELRDVTF